MVISLNRGSIVAVGSVTSGRAYDRITRLWDCSEVVFVRFYVATESVAKVA